MTFNITQGSNRTMTEGDAYIIIEAINRAHLIELGEHAQLHFNLVSQLRQEIKAKDEEIAKLKSLMFSASEQLKPAAYKEAPAYYSLDDIK